MVLFGKTIVHAEKVYFAGRECFSAAQGGAGAHFAEWQLVSREEIVNEWRTQVKTKLLRAKSPSYFSDPLYRNSIPTLQHSTPLAEEFVAAQRFRNYVPINEGGSQPHIFATEVCVV